MNPTHDWNGGAVRFDPIVARYRRVARSHWRRTVFVSKHSRLSRTVRNDKRCIRQSSSLAGRGNPSRKFGIFIFEHPNAYGCSDNRCFSRWCASDPPLVRNSLSGSGHQILQASGFSKPLWMCDGRAVIQIGGCLKEEANRSLREL